MIDRATGKLYTGSPVSSQRAARSWCLQPVLVAFRADVHVAAQVVDHAQHAHHHFAGRERRDRRAADPPIPAERPHGRLDPLPGPAQETVALMQAGREVVEVFRLVELGQSAAASLVPTFGRAPRRRVQSRGGDVGCTSLERG